MSWQIRCSDWAISIWGDTYVIWYGAAVHWNTLSDRSINGVVVWLAKLRESFSLFFSCHLVDFITVAAEEWVPATASLMLLVCIRCSILVSNQEEIWRIIITGLGKKNRLSVLRGKKCCHDPSRCLQQDWDQFRQRVVDDATSVDPHHAGGGT